MGKRQWDPKDGKAARFEQSVEWKVSGRAVYTHCRADIKDGSNDGESCDNQCRRGEEKQT